jgi:hypothetical protein
VAVTPSATTINLVLLNGQGYSTHVYYPGQVVGGTLYFWVEDYSDLDRTVNVTITDPHAALDHVSTPAFHYQATLNSTTLSFDSYTAKVGYTFPVNLSYGGQWQVNASAPSGGSVSLNPSVALYSAALTSSAGYGAVVPTEPLSLFWSLHMASNGATLYTRATNVSITGRYVGYGIPQDIFAQGSLALTPASAGEGQWNGTVPANTTPDTLLTFEVSALTVVNGHVTENESANVTVVVGALTIREYAVYLAPPSGGFNNATLYNGDIAASSLLVEASYYGFIETPVAGLPVNVSYWNGSAHVSPSGAPTSLFTNSIGEASFTFPVDAPPFVLNTYNANAVNFTVRLPGASSLYRWTQWANNTFTLYPASGPTVVLEVALDHSEYYAGATATATWSVLSTNVSKTGPITVVGWSVTGTSGATYQQGTLNSTDSSGSFTFPITARMASSEIEVEVYAANATEEFSGYADAMVLSPTLLLTPSYAYYSAGSTATVVATLYGVGFVPTIQYQVSEDWGSGGVPITNGTVANGSAISIPIPSTAPPTSILITAWASGSGQVVATSTARLYLAQGYSVLLGVTTPSSYSDGSYQPGQTITLTYQIISVGGAPLPQTATFELWAMGYPNVYLIPSTQVSGTYSFTIPSNAVQGTLAIELLATFVASGGNTCFPTGDCVGVATLSINPNPSVLNLELAGGMTVGWVTLLVLLIVVAVVLFLLFRRRGGRRFVTSDSTLAPPAPAPTTPPAEEWTPPEKEGAPEPEPTSAGDSGSSPPPLPEPPEGASR